MRGVVGSRSIFASGSVIVRLRCYEDPGVGCNAWRSSIFSTVSVTRDFFIEIRVLEMIYYQSPEQRNINTRKGNNKKRDDRINLSRIVISMISERKRPMGLCKAPDAEGFNDP